MAAPESATCHADISRVKDAVSVDLVNIDQVNGQRVSSQLDPHVSQRVTYKWGPWVNSSMKEKGKGGLVH